MSRVPHKGEVLGLLLLLFIIIVNFFLNWKVAEFQFALFTLSTNLIKFQYSNERIELMRDNENQVKIHCLL